MTLLVLQILATTYISGVVLVALLFQVDLFLGSLQWGTYKSPVHPAKGALLWPLFLLRNLLERVIK